jgi:hypothetical protein
MTDLIESRKKVADAAMRLGTSLPNLDKANQASQDWYKVARDNAFEKIQELKSAETFESPLDIIVVGSIARGEASVGQSDFDSFLVAYQSVSDPSEIQIIREAAKHAKSVLEMKPEGTFTGFGNVISGLDLVNAIGLEGDTNQNHTFRTLLLLESKSLFSEEGRADLVKSVIQRYLFDYLGGAGQAPNPKRGVPRFLLNDVVRYWRTLAVDYQSKRWEELHGKKWGLRYLKLRSSRKLLYAGTIISLFLPRIRKDALSVGLLFDQFELTPMARLAQIEGFIEDAKIRSVLKEIFELGDYFCGRFADEDFRTEVSGVENPRDPDAPLGFKEARKKTMKLEECLEALFMSTSPLEGAGAIEPSGEPLSMAHLSQRYLLF